MKKIPWRIAGTAGTETSNVIRSELRAYLEQLGNELSEEVRLYPTPTARCDEQLTKLLEQRAQAMQLLRRVDDMGQSASGLSRVQLLATIKDFLGTPQFGRDDVSEQAIRAHLKTALAKL